MTGIAASLPVPEAGGSAARETVAPNPKLVHAAQEFEAQMMKELLQPMTGGDALTDDADGADPELGSGSGSGGALADFASEALGRALSQRGGFGIASQIIRELSHSAKLSESGTEAGRGTLEGNPNSARRYRDEKTQMTHGSN
jgi:Rod binding domain-containing protein